MNSMMFFIIVQGHPGVLAIQGRLQSMTNLSWSISSPGALKIYYYYSLPIKHLQNEPRENVPAFSLAECAESLVHLTASDCIFLSMYTYILIPSILHMNICRNDLERAVDKKGAQLH